MNTTDTPPNQTLYVSNLYEKLKKEELKKVLYACFSPHGKVIDVVAVKSFRLRGQAWVVFDEVASAAEALRALQGFPLYDKPMRIQYARGKSDAVAKVYGLLGYTTRTMWMHNMYQKNDNNHHIVSRRTGPTDQGTPRHQQHTTQQHETHCKSVAQNVAQACHPPPWSPRHPSVDLCRASMGPPPPPSSLQATPSQTRFCLCKTSQRPPIPTWLPCCFSSLLGSRKCAWWRLGRGSHLSSLRTKHSRGWRCRVCRISRLHLPIQCTFPMQNSRRIGVVVMMVHVTVCD